MKNYLTTWFFAEQEGDESFYPSVGGATSSPEFQKVYWRCIYDLFKSALLTQHQCEIHYIFCTNVPNLPADMDGVDFRDFFRKNNIEVNTFGLTTRTPADWFGAWRNQFYVFDILNFLQNRDGNHLILDSDVFVTGDLTEVFADISKYGVIGYDCGFSDNYEENGVSQLQMRSLYQAFYGENAEGGIPPLKYKGGEMIGVTSGVIPGLLREYRFLWKKNYARYLSGLRKLNEEAHFLSVIYERLGLQNSVGNRYIKRMWTSFHYDTVAEGDEKFVLWHLPAEKKYAFRRMYQFLPSCEDGDRYRKKLRQVTHIPGKRMVRRAKRFFIRLKEKMTGI